MKTVLKPLLLLMLTALLSISAFAESGTGFYDIGEAEGVTVTPIMADGGKKLKVIWSEGDDSTHTLYDTSESLRVQFVGASGGHYLVLVTTAAKIEDINEQNLYYIDQVTAASDGTVTFDNIFPRELAAEGKTQAANLFIIGSTEDFDRKITLNYANHAAYDVPTYLLGDVDGDGEVLAKDAMFVLQNSVGLRTEYDDAIPLAGDVDGDGEILAKDAMFILQYSVGLLSTWPADA